MFAIWQQKMRPLCHQGHFWAPYMSIKHGGNNTWLVHFGSAVPNMAWDRAIWKNYGPTERADIVDIFYTADS